MKITLIKYPTDEDWRLCKECALETMWKDLKTEPTLEWRKSILRARHSPVRTLMFMFKMEGVHLTTFQHI